MRGKKTQIRFVMGIPGIRLTSPRILFTVDYDERDRPEHLRQLMDRFVRHGIPVTLFITNQALAREEDRKAIFAIIASARENRLPLETASHSVDHTDLSAGSPEEIVAIMEDSFSRFNRQGIKAVGFRAPYLATEYVYREVLARMTAGEGCLRYDSSICFESNLATSLFHALTRKKSPHKVGAVWEFPISCLDDYHLFRRPNWGARLAFFYWVFEVNLCIRSFNYFLVLIHPGIIIRHLSVLDRFLRYCTKRFPAKTFGLCTDLVGELESNNRPVRAPG